MIDLSGSKSREHMLDDLGFLPASEFEQGYEAAKLLLHRIATSAWVGPVRPGPEDVDIAQPTFYSGVELYRLKYEDRGVFHYAFWAFSGLATLEKSTQVHAKQYIDECAGTDQEGTASSKKETHSSNIIPLSDPVHLNGTSPPLHQVNKQAPIRLAPPSKITTDAQASAAILYLKLFCGLVTGEEGAFTIVEKPSDLLLSETELRELLEVEFQNKEELYDLAGVKGIHYEQIQELLKPVALTQPQASHEETTQVSPAESGKNDDAETTDLPPQLDLSNWPLTATTAYGGSLYLAQYKVFANRMPLEPPNQVKDKSPLSGPMPGMVEMPTDDPRYSLPTKRGIWCSTLPGTPGVKWFRAGSEQEREQSESLPASSLIELMDVLWSSDEGQSQNNSFWSLKPEAKLLLRTLDFQNWKPKQASIETDEESKVKDSKEANKQLPSRYLAVTEKHFNHLKCSVRMCDLPFVQGFELYRISVQFDGQTWSSFWLWSGRDSIAGKHPSSCLAPNPVELNGAKSSDKVLTLFKNGGFELPKPSETIDDDAKFTLRAFVHFQALLSGDETSAMVAESLHNLPGLIEAIDGQDETDRVNNLFSPITFGPSKINSSMWNVGASTVLPNGKIKRQAFSILLSNLNQTESHAGATENHQDVIPENNHQPYEIDMYEGDLREEHMDDCPLGWVLNRQPLPGIEYGAWHCLGPRVEKQENGKEQSPQSRHKIKVSQPKTPIFDSALEQVLQRNNGILRDTIVFKDTDETASRYVPKARNQKQDHAVEFDNVDFPDGIDLSGSIFEGGVSFTVCHWNEGTELSIQSSSIKGSLDINLYGGLSYGSIRLDHSIINGKFQLYSGTYGIETMQKVRASGLKVDTLIYFGNLRVKSSDDAAAIDFSHSSCERYIYFNQVICEGNAEFYGLKCHWLQWVAPPPPKEITDGKILWCNTREARVTHELLSLNSQTNDNAPNNTADDVYDEYDITGKIDLSASTIETRLSLQGLYIRGSVTAAQSTFGSISIGPRALYEREQQNRKRGEGVRKLVKGKRRKREGQKEVSENSQFEEQQDDAEISQTNGKGGEGGEDEQQQEASREKMPEFKSASQDKPSDSDSKEDKEREPSQDRLDIQDSQGSQVPADDSTARRECFINKGIALKNCEINSQVNFTVTIGAGNSQAIPQTVEASTATESNKNEKHFFGEHLAGTVCVIGCRVGGDLAVAGLAAQLLNMADADGGSARLNHEPGQDDLPTVAPRGVRIQGSRIGGNLDLRNLTCWRPESRLLVFYRDDEIAGTIRLTNLDIGGSLLANAMHTYVVKKDKNDCVDNAHAIDIGTTIKDGDSVSEKMLRVYCREFCIDRMQCSGRIFLGGIYAQQFFTKASSRDLSTAIKISLLDLAGSLNLRGHLEKLVREKVPSIGDSTEEKETVSVVWGDEDQDATALCSSGGMTLAASSIGGHFDMRGIKLGGSLRLDDVHIRRDIQGGNAHDENQDQHAAPSRVAKFHATDLHMEGDVVLTRLRVKSNDRSKAANVAPSLQLIRSRIGGVVKLVTRAEDMGGHTRAIVGKNIELRDTEASELIIAEDHFFDPHEQVAARIDLEGVQVQTLRLHAGDYWELKNRCPELINCQSDIFQRYCRPITTYRLHRLQVQSWKFESNAKSNRENFSWDITQFERMLENQDDAKNIAVYTRIEKALAERGDTRGAEGIRKKLHAIERRNLIEENSKNIFFRIIKILNVLRCENLFKLIFKYIAFLTVAFKYVKLSVLGWFGYGKLGTCLFMLLLLQLCSTVFLSNDEYITPSLEAIESSNIQVLYPDKGLKVDSEDLAISPYATPGDAGWGFGEAFALSLRYSMPMLPLRTQQEWRASRSLQDFGIVHTSPATVMKSIEAIAWLLWVFTLISFAGWIRSRRLWISGP